VSLAALHRLDGARARPYRAPLPKILFPAAFCSANLIIYWGGFDSTYKLVLVILVGWILFAIGTRVVRSDLAGMVRTSWWIVPWLVGCLVLGVLGRYGGYGAQNVLPEWWDLAAVIAFSLAIFYLAVRVTLPADQVHRAIAEDRELTELALAA
jgi:hypothetical protein